MSNKNWKACPPTTDLSAAELVARGYRKTSNAYGIISRIDRPDWLEVMAKAMRCAPADFILRDGSGQVSGNWCDHYRRVHSKDTHTVDQERMALIPSSGHDPVGFVQGEADNLISRIGSDRFNATLADPKPF